MFGRILFIVSSCYWAIIYPVEGVNSCPLVPNEGSLRFTKKLAGEDFARSGHFRLIECCAAGYNKIVWYKRERHAWKQYPWSSCQGSGCAERTTVPGENNQTMEFRSPSDPDEGQYRCVISHKHDSKRHDMYLNIVTCDTLGKGPYILSQPTDQTVNLGVDVTFTCAGYFGCGDKDIRDVDWYTRKQEDWVPMAYVPTNPRYNVTLFSRDNDTVLGANLTISNVQKEDLEVPFQCRLSTAYLRDGQRKATVRLHKKVPVTSEASMKMMIGLIVGGFVVLSLILIVIYAVIKKRYGPQVKFYVQSRLGRLPLQGDLNPDRTKSQSNNNKTLYAFPEIRAQNCEKKYGAYTSADKCSNV